jgi:hypothetical protein
MATPILYLNNSSNWESHYSGSFTAGAVIVNQKTIYAPILETTLPISFDKHLVAISVTSSTAKATWNFAGYASQKIQTGLLVGGQPESLVSRQSLWLNQITLIFFPKVANTYALSISPPKWFKDFSINTWQYIGEESDSTEVALAQMQITLNSIQAQLNN